MWTGRVNPSGIIPQMVNEFYKKRCQEKTSASTGGREDFCLEIQPTAVSVPPIRWRGFALACLPSLWGSSADGDDANRVWKLGKRVLVSSVSTMVLSEARGLSLFLVKRGGIA
jgi:hypothetical protein